MAGHEPMVMAITAGEMRFTANGEQQTAAVGCGFVEITGESIVVSLRTLPCCRRISM